MRLTVIPTRRVGDRLDFIRHEPGNLASIYDHAQLAPTLADSAELAVAVAEARPTVLIMDADTVRTLYVADADTAAILRRDAARLDSDAIAGWIIRCSERVIVDSVVAEVGTKLESTSTNRDGGDSR